MTVGASHTQQIKVVTRASRATNIRFAPTYLEWRNKALGSVWDLSAEKSSNCGVEPTAVKGMGRAEHEAFPIDLLYNG